MKPEISVVIPLYNKERYIRRTIDSVLLQTFQNFECVIIDSSTDASSYLVSQYNDPRIVHIKRKKTTAAQARNLGVQIAHSDFIAFLDADDEWQLDHLEALLNLKKKFPNAGLYSTPYVKLKPDGSPMVMLFPGIPRPPWEGYLPNYLFTCSRGDEPVHSSSCAIPKDIFNTMGGFPEDQIYGEDQFLWGKISLTYPIAFCWRGLIIYHTEALGRICENAHKTSEQPFSVYLKQQLTLGNITSHKKHECQAYIRRKRYTLFFSSLLTQESPLGCDDIIDNVENLIKQNYKIHHFSKYLKKVSRNFLLFIYNSSFHDFYKRLLCIIYQCYNPGLMLYHYKQK